MPKDSMEKYIMCPFFKYRTDQAITCEGPGEARNVIKWDHTGPAIKHFCHYCCSQRSMKECWVYKANMEFWGM